MLALRHFLSFSSLFSLATSTPLLDDQTLLARAADSFNWTLTTNVLNNTNGFFQAQPYVSNGYIGARLPAEGVGFVSFEPIGPQNGTQGWPLFTPRVTASNIAGFFDVQDSTAGTNFPQNGGEQVISLVPTWNTLLLTIGNSTYGVGVDNSTVSNFTQSLSIRNGVVQTSLTWTPNNSTPVSLTYTMIAHRQRPSLGLVRLDVVGLKEGQEVWITDVLDGAGAIRVQEQEAGPLNSTEGSNVIYSSCKPNGVSNVTAFEFSAFSLQLQDSSNNNQTLQTVPLQDSVLPLINTSSPSTSSQTFKVIAPSSGKLSAFKYVGIASSDAFSPNERDQALNTALKAREDGWDSLEQEHKEAWEDIWNQGGDVILHGDSEEERDLWLNARASLFHILSNAREGKEGKGMGDNSIAPAGLTSDSYAGGIFWDAETWMYPSLLALAPSYAESINNYRIKNFGAARENLIPYPNNTGALYPWVSFRYGNATGIGPVYDYEYHLNNDIVLAMQNYYDVTGNKTWLEDFGYPIMQNVSAFWASKVVLEEDGLYHAYNMTDPDEYANHQNDGAFTMAGISTVMNFTIKAAEILGKQVPSNWSEIASKIAVLVSNDSDIILEYEGFNASTPVKQADVTLLTYPLEYETPNPLADLDFYAGATSPNGPAMTYSSFSVNAAQLGQGGCEAYTYLLASSLPYSRAPFAQFSEQSNDIYSLNGGTNPAFTFLTGHGGYLQTFTHGFSGYRFRPEGLYFDPSLPPQLSEGYTVKGMKYRGATLDVTVSPKNTIISNRANGESVKIEVGKRNSKGGNYTLASGDKLSIPTTRLDLLDPTFSGNLAQCKSITSNSTWVPGQFPVAAIDGSNATLFQSTTSLPTSLTVDLGSSQSVSSISLNFGKNPPQFISLLSGTDLENLSETVSRQSVNISSPYDEVTANQVKVSVGNTTSLELQSQKARYVQLVIEGAMFENELDHGATVAEFNIL